MRMQDHSTKCTVYQFRINSWGSYKCFYLWKRLQCEAPYILTSSWNLKKMIKSYQFSLNYPAFLLFYKSIYFSAMTPDIDIDKSIYTYISKGFCKKVITFFGKLLDHKISFLTRKCNFSYQNVSFYVTECSKKRSSIL